MSRKAAIITGNISESRGTIHAYVVFHEEPAALAALASNMHLVGYLCPLKTCWGLRSADCVLICVWQKCSLRSVLLAQSADGPGLCYSQCDQPRGPLLESSHWQLRIVTVYLAMSQTQSL